MGEREEVAKAGGEERRRRRRRRSSWSQMERNQHLVGRPVKEAMRPGADAPPRTVAPPLHDAAAGSKKSQAADISRHFFFLQEAIEAGVHDDTPGVPDGRKRTES
ncbi:hypothetical protein EYF80_066812 [Liparis tanakae]|uniref:Uncharacterized protein n=1 Tax=Liparis tanakae TaxID=230148 RepID=A0A4Z2E2X1_9TELE|nr:hypothetical protein EYF80_066812 [Liparis tanakae]